MHSHVTARVRTPSSVWARSPQRGVPPMAACRISGVEDAIWQLGIRLCQRRTALMSPKRLPQWPGHAAEEVEQQITVPLEVQLNGVSHMTHLRSTSLAGLSVITIIYDDEITTFNARQEALQRLAQTNMPALGFSTSQAIRWSPSTRTSRRSWYSAACFSTSASHCRIATMAAIWIGWKVP